MYKKILIGFLFVVSANATIFDGVAIVVEDKPITTYDIKKLMQVSGFNEKKASEILIRQALEQKEMKKRSISVDESEVYEAVRNIALRNNMSVETFYSAIETGQGISRETFKQKIKEQLLHQKLFQAIASSAIQEPSKEELKEYYELHKKRFEHPKSFDVIIYRATNRVQLFQKMQNPMLYLPQIQMKEQVLSYEKIAPELLNILEKTPQNSFTPILPDGRNGYMSFYIKEKKTDQKTTFADVEDEVKNVFLTHKREAVLSDYFARLKNNADIKFIRGIDNNAQ
ncbi:hypothetical protein MNB_SM-3-822 [hydrothermal vent metagenome]|uniref:Cj1289-like C-terminal domain-containing protein n=1 Tax=hydrothermal vent metagenome TaxID=652676 RepID=A0A1W1D641_9ZZZZ